MDLDSKEEVKKAPLDKEEAPLNPGIVVLNIGGQKFVTTRTLLTSRPSTMLGRMFAAANAPMCKPNFSDAVNTEQFYFDRDPAHFARLLGWYRTGELVLPKDSEQRSLLRREMQFWGIDVCPLAQRMISSVQLEAGSPDAVDIRCFLDAWLESKPDFEFYHDQPPQLQLFLQRYEPNMLRCWVGDDKRLQSEVQSTFAVFREHPTGDRAAVSGASDLKDRLQKIAQDAALPISSHRLDNLRPLTTRAWRFADAHWKAIRNLHPIVAELYWRVLTGMENTQLTAKQADDADDSMPIHRSVLEHTLLLFQILIDGARLFWMEGSRQYALAHLARCGLHAEWRSMQVRCDGGAPSKADDEPKPMQPPAVWRAEDAPSVAYPLDAGSGGGGFSIVNSECSICRMHNYDGLTSCRHWPKVFPVPYLHLSL